MQKTLCLRLHSYVVAIDKDYNRRCSWPTNKSCSFCCWRLLNSSKVSLVSPLAAAPELSNYVCPFICQQRIASISAHLTVKQRHAVDAADGLKTLNMQHGTLLLSTLARKATSPAKSVLMLSQALELNGAFFTSLQNQTFFKQSLPSSTTRCSIPAVISLVYIVVAVVLVAAVSSLSFGCWIDLQSACCLANIDVGCSCTSLMTISSKQATRSTELLL